MHTFIVIALIVAFIASISVGSPQPAPSNANGTNNASSQPTPGNASQNNTPGCNIPDMPNIQGVDCDKMKWAHYGVAGLTILVGLVWCFFGYRVLRVGLFLAGFILLSFVTYQTLSAFPTVTNGLGQYSDYIILGIAALLGIIGGVLVLKLLKLGVFFMGFIFGAVIAVVVVSFTPLISVISANINLGYTKWVVLACIVGLGILCGIVAVIFIRPIVIFVTAWNGAFVVMYPVDKMIGTDLLHILKGAFTGSMSLQRIDPATWPPYVIFGGIVLLGIAGIVVQTRLTSRGHHHDHTGRKPFGEDEIPLIQDV